MKGGEREAAQYKGREVGGWKMEHGQCYTSFTLKGKL